MFPNSFVVAVVNNLTLSTTHYWKQVSWDTEWANPTVQILYLPHLFAFTSLPYPIPQSWLQCLLLALSLPATVAAHLASPPSSPISHLLASYLCHSLLVLGPPDCMLLSFLNTGIQPGMAVPVFGGGCGYMLCLSSHHRVQKLHCFLEKRCMHRPIEIRDSTMHIYTEVYLTKWILRDITGTQNCSSKGKDLRMCSKSMKDRIEESWHRAMCLWKIL